jgi:hypothetical protein
MKVKLPIDSEDLTKARQLDSAKAIAELERLWREEEGDLSGWVWGREWLYDRPASLRGMATRIAQ